MFRSKERQNRIFHFPCQPETSYLSVLVANWKLADTYRKLRLVVNNGILCEETTVKCRQKLGYGKTMKMLA